MNVKTEANENWFLQRVFFFDLCGFMDFSAFNIKQFPMFIASAYNECVYFDTKCTEKFAFSSSCLVCFDSVGSLRLNIYIYIFVFSFTIAFLLLLLLCSVLRVVCAVCLFVVRSHLPLLLHVLFYLHSSFMNMFALCL